MSKKENDIEEFFKELHQEDKNLEIPSFEAMYGQSPNRFNYWMVSGIAASILIVFGIYTVSISPNKSSAAQEVVLGPLDIGDTGTSLLITNINTVDSWSSPSNSLINDYHEW